MMCKNKVAVITGAAGTGMGRSIALTLAREGAKVTVNYKTSEESALEIVDYIKGRNGEATACQADVMQSNGCKRLVNTATEAFGKIDICIIGPGGGWHPETIDKLDSQGALDDAYKELSPVYNLMPLILPGMYERKWGRIVGISLLASIPSPAYAYNAGKTARTSALLLAHKETWKYGVTVNVIAPGPVQGISSLSEAIELCEHGSAWQDRTNITPQDIAEGVALLSSDSGRFITGCELPYLFF